MITSTFELHWIETVTKSRNSMHIHKVKMENLKTQGLGETGKVPGKIPDVRGSNYITKIQKDWLQNFFLL